MHATGGAVITRDQFHRPSSRHLLKRLAWTLAAVAASTAVYFTIRYGLRPKPIPVMNPTEFENTEQVGAVIYKRLRQGVRAERLILLGSRVAVPEESTLWRGFLKAAAADHEKIVYVARAGLDPSSRPDDQWETTVLDPAASTPEEFRRRITERIKAGQLVVVHGQTDEVTHLVAGSLGRELESIVQHPVLSISTLPFAVDEPGRAELNPPCLEVGEMSDQRRLACAARRVAVKFARKALNPGKIWAVVERHGLKEYLVFLHLVP